MTLDQVKPHKILRGPLFAEPVEVLVTIPMGNAVKLLGRGLQTSTVVDIILTEEKLKLLETTPDTEPFDGDAKMFRLGIEAMRLGLAFEYDPYFSLSIAKVDPLPHQLEAVYDYFMRLPRIRFLLADDPGAGKTIMAGLTTNEYNTAKRLKKDYYLYIALHCATTPSLNIFQDPATLDWQPVAKVEHYRLKQDSIKHPVELKEDSVPYRVGGTP